MQYVFSRMDQGGELREVSSSFSSKMTSRSPRKCRARCLEKNRRGKIGKLKSMQSILYIKGLINSIVIIGHGHLRPVKIMSCFSSVPMSISGFKKDPCAINMSGKGIFSFLPVFKASF